MKYCTLFFSKIRKDVANMSSAAVVIGALRVKRSNRIFRGFSLSDNQCINESQKDEINEI